MAAWSGPAGRLVDLAEDECWQLLRSRPVGRLAWMGSAGVTVIPMNYTVEDGAVWLRTAAYGAAAQECHERDVAFEVDEIDPETRSGWSVLVRGRSHYEAGAGATPGPEPWAPGIRQLRMWIDVSSISGRRILPA